MARLYLNGRLSKCFMHYNEKRHLYSHKALSVSAHVCCFQRGGIPSSSQPDDTFPTPLFLSHFYPKHPHNTFFSFPSPLSAPEYPVFHLAARWAVWMCLVSYVTSFLESLPPAHCHCITCQLLCASQWGSFFSAFLRHKYDPPNGDGIKLGAECQAAPPNTGETIPPCSRMTCYITAEAKRTKVVFGSLKCLTL